MAGGPPACSVSLRTSPPYQGPTSSSAPARSSGARPASRLQPTPSWNPSWRPWKSATSAQPTPNHPQLQSGSAAGNHPHIYLPMAQTASHPHNPAHWDNIIKLKEALEQRLGRYLATTDSVIKIIKPALKSTCKKQQATKAEGASCILPSDLKPPAPSSHAPSNRPSQPIVVVPKTTISTAHKMVSPPSSRNRSTFACPSPTPMHTVLGPRHSALQDPASDPIATSLDLKRTTQITSPRSHPQPRPRTSQTDLGFSLTRLAALPPMPPVSVAQS